MRASSLVALVLALTGCANLGIFGDEDFAVSGDAPSDGAIPRRPANAMRGSEFLRYVEKMSVEQREAAILKEARSGNIPGFLRRLQPVKVTSEQGGQVVEGVFWTMPDYLAIGSNDDNAYMPMNPITAQKVADHFGFILPTRKMVDEIHGRAKVQLKPAPMKPGPSMATTDYYRKHDEAIKTQMSGIAAGTLVSGHKKDVVLSNLLCQVKRRVAIYGWHKEDGRPIQPLSTVHGELYADYSHGIRLVSNTMVVNGVEHPVVEVLQNTRWAPLISDEGILRQVRIAIDCRDC